MSGSRRADEGLDAATEPPRETLSDAQILRRLNALAAAALDSGQFDKAEAARLAEAAKGRWSDEEFARAVRHAAERQLALKRAAQRGARPVDPLAERAAAGYRAASSFSR